MLQAVFALLITLAVLAVVMSWTLVIRRLLDGAPLIRQTKVDPVPWDIFVMAATLGLLLLLSAVSLQLVAAGTGRSTTDLISLTGLPSSIAAVQVAAQSGATLVTLLVVVGLVLARYGPCWRALGLEARHGWNDLRLAVIAFLILAPVVYGLQALLVQWFESRHPLVLLLQRDRHPVLVLAVVTSAVVVAPIVEEFLFRVLLQGWLESLFEGVGAAPLAARPPTDSAIALLPVVISSVTFGLVHWEHGPDFLPLTVLALGLGYIYQKTHRVLPCIFVHALLNGVSIGVLLIELFWGGA